MKMSKEYKENVRNEGAIVFDPKGGGPDFVFKRDAWITVGPFSIWLRKSRHVVKADGKRGTRKAIILEVYPTGKVSHTDALHTLVL